MGLAGDWLEPVIAVPYVPTIGPVHPRTLGAGPFCDVLTVAEGGRFLDYDKDRRWFNWKDETVLCGAVEHGPARTLIPTLSRRREGSIAVYAYGPVRRISLVVYAATLRRVTW